MPHRTAPLKRAALAAFAVLAAPAALAVLAGCSGGTGDTGTTLRVDLVGSPADAGRAITAATQIGLVGVDGKGDVVPALASSWRIAGDGQSVIFRLRPRRWPDGRAVTATDVVASFRRIAAPGSRNPARPMLAALASGAAILRGTAPATMLGVDAPVDNVVEVRAAGAMPGLLALLAQPEFAVVAGGPRPPPLGPLRVVDAGQRPIMLVPNRAAPPGTAVTIALTPTDDPGAAIARFAHDRTDVVVGRGLAGFDDARLLTGSNALRVEPTRGVYGYLIHPRGALASPLVRRALAMAVDRDDLGSRLFGVALPPVLGLVPALPAEPAPALPDWAIEAPAARLDLARQLLAAAGFDATHPLTVAISLPDAREHANVAAEVAADWARIGVATTTVVRSPAAHAAAIARGDFDLALVERDAHLDSALPFLLPFACRADGAAPTGPQRRGARRRLLQPGSGRADRRGAHRDRPRRRGDDARGRRGGDGRRHAADRAVRPRPLGAGVAARHRLVAERRRPASAGVTWHDWRTAVRGTVIDASPTRGGAGVRRRWTARGSAADAGAVRGEASAASA